ncbi:peptidylprolyl isomerase [Candidatus Saccharibacteria bacterium]|jgi:foldase protein PrsA|nr:peptidylprolyl isomerase [Candidatus Saccharibacteria bacterium]
MFKKKKSTPKLHKSRRFLKIRAKKKLDTSEVATEPVPRITNETITQHREEVLKGARKYIYPLQHSKHKIVIFSVIIMVLVTIGFLTYVILSLYRWQTTSDFMYQVTKVVPVPVARTGKTLVYYEDYLFELRHYIHYFEKQQQVDFSSEQGQAQLTEQRRKSLENVINYAYVKKIARQKGLRVTTKEVDNQINLLRDQNKLGSDNKVFENVLKDYWGWTIIDFRRSVEQGLLTSKVLQALDTTTQAKANKVLGEIRAGKDFATLAKKYSDDSTTKDRGGQLGFLVSKNDRNMPPQTVDALFNLKTGEVSDVINLGYGLEIIKNDGSQEGKLKASRIFFAYKDINHYLNDYKEQQRPQAFIKI